MERRHYDFRVIIKRADPPNIRRYIVCTLSFLFCTLIVAFISNRDGSFEDQTSTVLTVRSATLVVKDLADQWELSHYDTQPFEFCGRSVLSNRELKACADHFLSLVTGDGGIKGLPSVPAYDICMQAQNDYQLKSCVYAVSVALKPADFIALQVLSFSRTPQ